MTRHYNATLAISGLALALLFSSLPLEEAAAARATDFEVTPEILLQSTPGLEESLQGHRWAALHTTRTLAEIITVQDNGICRTTVAIEIHSPPARVPGSLRRTFSIQDETSCAPPLGSLEQAALQHFPGRILSQPPGVLQKYLEEALPEDLCYPGLTLRLQLEGEIPTSPQDGASLVSTRTISMTPTAISSQDAPNAARECMESILPEKITLPFPNLEAIVPFLDEAPGSIHLSYELSFPAEESEEERAEESKASPVEIVPTSITPMIYLFRTKRCFHLFESTVGNRPVDGFMICY